MIQTKTLQQFTQDMLTAWGVNTGVTPPTTDQSGDPLVATDYALASQLVFIQAIVLQAYAFARAGTSSGADLDSWFAQFGFKRSAAEKASGGVTLSAFSAHGSDVYAPVDSLVQTSGGAVQYALVADTANVSGVYVDGLGYKLAAGQTSITNVQVQATTGGTAGNAQIGQINQLASALPGFDAVTNPSAFTNGTEAESDSAALARFIDYINSLAKATYTAIKAAVESVTAVDDFTINELLAQGSPPVGFLGSFLVLASDNATDGSLSSTTRDEVFDAVDAVRAFTVMAGVQAPTELTADVHVYIKIDPAATDPSAVQTAVQTAITDYVNSLVQGQTFYLEKVSQIAEDVDLVVAVQAGTSTINGVPSDLTALFYQIIKAGTITVSTF